MSNLEMVVNGAKYKIKLDNGGVATLGITSAMEEEDNNTITLPTKGKDSGSVKVERTD